MILLAMANHTSNILVLVELKVFGFKGKISATAPHNDEIITLIEWLSAAGTTFINFADVVAVGFGNIIEIGKNTYNGLANQVWLFL